MRKLLLILNPVAGKGKGLEKIDEIESFFTENKFDYDLVRTNYIGEAEEISNKLNENKYTDVIVVGGDGTVVEVINGLKGKNIRLGILPVGTGNDFIRSIDEFSIKDSLLAIKTNRTKEADIGIVNGKYFINVTGFGMDSYILKNMDKIKRFFSGALSYNISTIFTLFQYKSKKVEIEIDGKSFKRDIMLVAICNGIYFGGGMKISPNSLIDDQKFELVVVNKMSKLKFLSVFLKVYKGTHLNVKEVEVFSGVNFNISSDEEIPINIDGNLYGKTPINVSLAEEKIKVFY